MIVRDGNLRKSKFPGRSPILPSFVAPREARWPDIMLMVNALDSGAALVRAQVGDIVWCSWTRHFSLTVPLFTQVYKWVLANC